MDYDHEQIAKEIGTLVKAGIITQFTQKELQHNLMFEKFILNYIDRRNFWIKALKCLKDKNLI